VRVRGRPVQVIVSCYLYLLTIMYYFIQSNDFVVYTQQINFQAHTERISLRIGVVVFVTPNIHI
jgi:hypothetical protein